MTDRVIKLDARLPGGDANGLADGDVTRKLHESDRSQMHVGIFFFTVPKWETDAEKDTVTGKASIKRIEAILSNTKGDASALERLLTRAYERRTGVVPLDHDLEGEVRAAFDGIRITDEDDDEDED